MTKTCNALGHFGSNNPQEIWDPKLKQMLPMLPTEEDFKRKRQRKEARKHKRYSGPVWFPHTLVAHIPSKFENTYKATLNHLKNKNSFNIWLFVHDKKIAGESWRGEPTGHWHVACALPHLRKRGWPGLARSGYFFHLSKWNLTCIIWFYHSSVFFYVFWLKLILSC